MVDSQTTGGTVDCMVSIWRALGTPSSGTLTIDYGVDTQLGIVYKQVEWSGVDTSGTNGSGAIVQTAKNQTTAGTTQSLTLGSGLGSASNAEFAVFGAKANTTFTVEAGWTETDAEQGGSSPAMTLATAYRTGEDLTVVGTFGTTGSKAGIIVEIKASSGASSTDGKLIFRAA
jgi:hypothetical protein